MSVSNKKYLTTILIHSIASLSALLIGVIILRRFGIEAQGEIAYVRSWIEVASIFGQFGFLQAFSFFIHTKKSDEFALRSFSWGYSVLCFIAAFLVAIIFPLHNDKVIESAFLSALTAALTIYQGLIRALSLAVRSSLRFLLITVSYPVSMLLVFICWPTKYSASLIYALLASLVISCLVSLFIFGKSYSLTNKPLSINITKLNIADLVGYGFSAFLPAFILGALPYIIYKIMLLNGMTHYEISIVSLAVLILNSTLLPLNMLQPILYRQWIGISSFSAVYGQLLKLFCVGLVWLLLVCAVTWKMSGSIFYVLFGKELPLLTEVVDTLLYASFFMLVTKLLTIYFQARHLNYQIAIANFVRVAITVLAIKFYSSSVKAISLAWILGEALGSLILLLLLFTSLGNKTMPQSGSA